MGIILIPSHKKWEEFTEAMWAFPEPCNHTTKAARSILQTMKGVDVDGTLEYFKTRGGYCDCEIRMKVCH